MRVFSISSHWQPNFARRLSNLGGLLREPTLIGNPQAQSYSPWDLKRGWVCSHSSGTLCPSQCSVPGRQPFTKQQEGGWVIREYGNSFGGLVFPGPVGLLLKEQRLPSRLKGAVSGGNGPVLLGSQHVLIPHGTRWDPRSSGDALAKPF